MKERRRISIERIIRILNTRQSGRFIFDHTLPFLLVNFPKSLFSKNFNGIFRTNAIHKPIINGEKTSITKDTTEKNGPKLLIKA
jgi:hypothetical protein